MFSSLDLACMRRVSLQVRDSLEKVRERMYGQFGGMQQSMQKLSQEIRVKDAAAPCDCLRKCVKLGINVKMHAPVWLSQEANTHRRSLESEVKTRTSAMDTYDQMNSSLISANISLQVTHVTQSSVLYWPLLVLHKHTRETRFLFQRANVSA